MQPLLDLIADAEIHAHALKKWSNESYDSIKFLHIPPPAALHVSDVAAPLGSFRLLSCFFEPNFDDKGVSIGLRPVHSFLYPRISEGWFLILTVRSHEEHINSACIVKSHDFEDQSLVGSFTLATR